MTTYHTFYILLQDGKTAIDVAIEAKRNGVDKLLREKKSRWLFPRKKTPVVAMDQTDGGTLHRSSSISSLESNSEGESDVEQEFYSNIEQQQEL